MDALTVVSCWLVVWGVVPVRGMEEVNDIVPSNSTEVVSKILSKQCTHKYSLSCLKLDAVRMVDKLSLTPAYRLLPGVSLIHTNYTLISELPAEVMGPLVAGNDSALDSLLAARVSEYLNSLTLSVKLLDSGTVNSARALSERILIGKLEDDKGTGRKKGAGGAALIAAGTMAAVGMAGLAAVAGKAMMTSMLALMLSAAGALRGGGGGGGGGGGKDCSYAYPAAKRSIAVGIQERPVYRPSYTPTYGPASR